MITKMLMDNMLHYYGHARAVLPLLFRHPLAYFLYITGGCNLNCEYCWQRDDQSRKDSWSNSASENLGTEEWLKLIDSLPRFCFIGISGGEPTLSKSFEPILARACERGIPVTINTNGSTLDERTAGLLIQRCVKNVSISLDGFASTHDKSRGMDGLFDTIIRGIKELNQARTGRKRPALTIKTVLLNDNVAEMHEFRRFCAEELRANTLNISLAKTGDHAQFSLKYNDNLDEVFHADKEAGLYDYGDPRRVEDVLAGLLEDNRKSSCRVTLYPQMTRRGQLHAFLENRGRNVYRDCRLPWALVVVLPDGQVVPCLSYGVGNVRDYDFDIGRLLQGGRYASFLKKVGSFGNSLPGTCNVCCFARVDREF